MKKVQQNNDRNLNVHTNHNNYSLEKMKRKRRKEKGKNKILAFAVVVIIGIVFFAMLFDKLFVISNFRIQGSKQYTQEQAHIAAEKLGIFVGDNMFSFNREKMQEKAKYYLSEFDEVKIEYDFPDTVLFRVKEAQMSMYTEFNGKSYVLSQNLRVIQVEDDPIVAENAGLVRVYIDNVEKCTAGDFLKADEKSLELLKNLCKILKEEELIHNTTDINIKNMFDITFSYENRIDVHLGDAENLVVKVRFMKSILNELEEDASGIIDVSDDELKEGYFKAWSKM